MELRVDRRWKKDGYTIGNLYIDGKLFCNTLEDKDRGLRQDMPVAEIQRLKAYGKTAIPTGRYRIDMDTVSAKFRSRVWATPYGGRLPLLLSVPGYAGVLVHVGNSAEDTDGCILVGTNSAVGKVLNSAATFCELMDKHLLPAFRRHEEIWITIE